MSKSIKFKNDKYLSTTGVMYVGKDGKDAMQYWSLDDLCSRLFGFIALTGTNIDSCRKCGIYRFFTTETEGTLPSGLSGNQIVVFVGTDNGAYNTQLAFSFGSDKLAMRRCSGSTTWTNWKYITFT